MIKDGNPSKKCSQFIFCIIYPTLYLYIKMNVSLSGLFFLLQNRKHSRRKR